MLSALGAGAPELVAQLDDVIITLMIVIPLSERVGSAQLSRQVRERGVVRLVCCCSGDGE